MVSEKGNPFIEKFLIHFALMLFSIVCLIPFISVLSVSFSDEKLLLVDGFNILPRGFTFEAYRYVFQSPDKMLGAYKVTIITTALGTFLNLLFNSMMAYALSRNDFRYKGRITFYIFITMIFGGGLIPTYMVVANVLDLKDTLWALVLPLVASPYAILILRTFFKSIPASLTESAKIDGANDFYCYARIIIPLSKPALATVGLLNGLSIWNDWWNVLLYIEDKSLYNLQYLLQSIIKNLDFLKKTLSQGGNIPINMADLPGETVRMAMCIVAAGPMLFAVIFLQKYFVRGMTVGSIKG